MIKETLLAMVTTIPSLEHRMHLYLFLLLQGEIYKCYKTTEYLWGSERYVWTDAECEQQKTCGYAELLEVKGKL
jgi:hypothetical protein